MGKKKLKKKNIELHYERYSGGVLVFLISFWTYLKTLTPSIAFHDGGELISSAYLLGIPHPPGYPLYCLLGKLWMTILPIGNIAYRMNLASALCASLVCMMVYFIVLKVTSGQWRVASEKENNLTSRISSLVPAIVGALMLAFATTFWEQAIIAEKYTLNALFATLLIFILLKWQEVIIEDRGQKSEVRSQRTEVRNQKIPITRLPDYPITYTRHLSLLYLFAFTLGLSFTHHFQTTFLIPASIFLIIATLWKKFRFFNLHFAICILYILAPLSLYLYLPLRAMSCPVINMGDPQTMERFLEHIKIAQFSGYFDSSISDVFNRGCTYLTQFFIHQWTIYLVGFGLIGAFFLFKHQLKVFIFLALILMVNILYSLFYNIPNIQDYYLPAFIVFAIWIGYGIQVFQRLMTKFKIQNSISFCPLLLLSLPFILLIAHYHQNDRSQYYFADDLVRNILRPLEDRSIIFLETDDTAYPSWYAHYVECQKIDAIFIDVPFLAVHYDWYARHLKKKYPDLSFNFKFDDMLGVKTKELEEIRIARIYNIILNNISSHPIYKLYDDSYAKNYSLVPQGIFCRVFEKDISKEKLSCELDKNRRFLHRGVKKILDKRTQETISKYPQGYYNVGSFYFGIDKYDTAIEKFKQALEIEPKHLNANYGLGMAYKNKDMFAEAIVKFEEILKIDPGFAKAYYGIGCVSYEQGKILSAINAYKNALEIEPKLNFVRVNLGVAYLDLQMLKEAILEFKKVIELAPQDVNAYLNLGLAYTKNKEYQKAIETYQKVLQLVPNHPQALANISYLRYTNEWH